jgi:hypothetical protein
MFFAMYCSPQASWPKVLAALLILISASLTTPTHAVDFPKDATVWSTEPPSDSGQNDVCLCDALVICTTAALYPLLNSEYPSLCSHGSFSCLAGVSARGRVPGVLLPPPKIA